MGTSPTLMEFMALLERDDHQRVRQLQNPKDQLCRGKLWTLVKLLIFPEGGAVCPLNANPVEISS